MRERRDGRRGRVRSCVRARQRQRFPRREERWRCVDVSRCWNEQQSIDRMENLTVKLKTVENRNMKAAYAKQSKQAARRPGRQASQHDQRCSFINVA
ncbi:hypothetical protein T12_3450 [Trichinella patagoniensis]|uniref:Uncharacterized protein n=1 Tax=Trichinella patagoniensis TaxID=990121 RepID=A0A0V0ZQR7_9BILA|nr:hypothetical protein T12_3450 [Trichinella patagoniensis]